MSWIIWLILAIYVIALIATFGVLCCVRVGSLYDKACCLDEIES